jgi:hypothetical protein
MWRRSTPSREVIVDRVKAVTVGSDAIKSTITGVREALARIRQPAWQRRRRPCGRQRDREGRARTLCGRPQHPFFALTLAARIIAAGDEALTRAGGRPCHGPAILRRGTATVQGPSRAPRLGARVDEQDGAIFYDGPMVAPRSTDSGYDPGPDFRTGRGRRPFSASISRIEDGREPWWAMYPLAKVLLLLICAIIASCGDFEGDRSGREIRRFKRGRCHSLAVRYRRVVTAHRSREMAWHVETCAGYWRRRIAIRPAMRSLRIKKLSLRAS